MTFEVVFSIFLTGAGYFIYSELVHATRNIDLRRQIVMQVLVAVGTALMFLPEPHIVFIDLGMCLFAFLGIFWLNPDLDRSR